VKNYEGMFILNTAENEAGVQAIVDRLSASIADEGATVLNVQKLDKKSFARVANKKYQNGYYVNYVFSAEPDVLPKLQTKYDLDEEVFRVLFTLAAEEQQEETAA
jgi:small subunit ribosomal protein S6